MKASHRPLIISVIGGGFPPPEALRQAEEVGRELAKRGIVVVCGGLTGVMEAVCKGAKEEGGL
ncbi:MAG: TIGR00725 family protein, partial [Chloroflexi bacterium]|nr:TIGR00725 family protein [Chloroflexota bacterium]